MYGGLWNELGARAALLVVDLQNDFADPRGALYVRGAEQIIEVINELVRSAERAGACVVYTQDWHPPSTPHFTKDGGEWPVHCVRDTWGAQLHSELHVVGPVVRKGTGGEDGYSGFSVRGPGSGTTTPTELEPLLRAHAVDTTVVVGLATDYCVRHTALDARRLGFRTLVLADATRPVDRSPGDGLRALEELRTSGVEVR